MTETKIYLLSIIPWNDGRFMTLEMGWIPFDLINQTGKLHQHEILRVFTQSRIKYLAS